MVTPGPGFPEPPNRPRAGSKDLDPKRPYGELFPECPPELRDFVWDQPGRNRPSPNEVGVRFALINPAPESPHEGTVTADEVREAPYGYADSPELLLQVTETLQAYGFAVLHIEAGPGYFIGVVDSVCTLFCARVRRSSILPLTSLVMALAVPPELETTRLGGARFRLSGMSDYCWLKLDKLQDEGRLFVPCRAQ